MKPIQKMSLFLLTFIMLFSCLTDIAASGYAEPVDGGKADFPGIEDRLLSSDQSTAEGSGEQLYTVEFTYGDSTYVLAGGSSAPLTDILAYLGLTGETASWSVSDPALFDIYWGGSDGVAYEAEKPVSRGNVPWLVSLRPFDTEEWAKIVIDGTEYRITVTDDNTTQNVPDDIKYSNVIKTKNDENNAVTGDTYVNGRAKPENVMQSNSTTTVTDFAAGLPLSTIYIDQSQIGTDKGIFHKIENSPYADCLEHNPSSGRVSYDATKGKPIKPGVINKLEGDLFYFIFEDAAILQDGSTADLKITYSDAQIVVDQRYSYSTENVAPLAYQGNINLAEGSTIDYSGTDATQISEMSDGKDRQNLVSSTVGQYKNANGTDQTFMNSSIPVPMLGQRLDATYQIVDKAGNPIEGTFIFAICGINLDRDPYKYSSNNYAKPLWYVNDFTEVDSNGNKINIGEAFHFFSEAMSINSGMASDYIYVRPNITVNDINETATDNKAYYYPQVIVDNNGHTQFISNGFKADNGNNYAYCSGFVVLADARGFKVTATGHGGSGQTAMSTNAFSSTTIWYRYTSESSAGGTIQTTSEGNYGGTLNDKSNKGITSNLLEPGTYVVPEGKTVIYRLTPEPGYHISALKIENAAGKLEEITFNNAPLSGMQKDDEVKFTDAAGREGTLTAIGNGEFILTLPYAKHDEYVRVDWEKPLGTLNVEKKVTPEIPTDENFDFTIVAYKDKDKYTTNTLFSIWNDGGVLKDENGPISSVFEAKLNGIKLEKRERLSSTKEVWETNAKLSDIGKGGDSVLYVDFWRAPNAKAGEALGDWLGKERMYFYELIENPSGSKLYWNLDNETHQDAFYKKTFSLAAGGTKTFEIPYDYQYVVMEASKEGWELLSSTNDEGIIGEDPITATLINTKTEPVTVTKTWADNDNNDRARPKGIVLRVANSGGTPPVKDFVVFSNNADNLGSWTLADDYKLDQGFIDSYFGALSLAQDHAATSGRYSEQDLQIIKNLLPVYGAHRANVDNAIKAYAAATAAETAYKNDPSADTLIAWKKQLAAFRASCSTISNIQVTESEKNSFSCTIWLPVLPDGQSYTVDEYDIAGYTKTVDGLTLTNTHTPGNGFKFSFTKVWQGDYEDSIDWVLYNPDGTVAHKGFKKKIVSEYEWHYEAWFSSGTDYYIIETVPAGYMVRYENVGVHAGETDRCYNGGTIINYKVPKTGDNADLVLWLGCVLLGVSAVCGTLVFRRRKKGNR
ncbi:MAG: Cna B-type domain-containing protein [Clostridia bacterium]|nr:Cna B-type domain-containing protein [Clostridia bacterium]